MTEPNDDEWFDAVSSISADVESKENAGRATVSPAASYLDDDGKSICAICLEDENEQFYSTRCNHSFHSECLKVWLRKKSSCPICRSPIKDTGSNGSPVSEHSADESDSREENRDMFARIFVRSRLNNERFPPGLSFDFSLMVVTDEELDGDMSELLARVENVSLNESSDSESNDREHFGSGGAPDGPMEFTQEDLYPIFTRIRPSSEHFPNELTYEEFLRVLWGENGDIWLLFLEYFNQRSFLVRHPYNQPDST